MNIKNFLDSNRALPSAPAIAGRILDAVRGESESNTALASVIATDPALTARILALANSSVYSPGRNVTRVDTAIGIIGTNALKNIALSFVVMRNLGKQNAAGLELEPFIKRAVTGAVATDLAAKAVHFPGDLFASALLRDIGMMALAVGAPEAYTAIVSEAGSAGAALPASEQRVFGFDHATLGEALLLHWGLPAEIGRPIRHHHQADAAPAELAMAADLLHVGDCVAAIYHGFASASPLAEIKATLGGKYGVAESAIEAMIDTVAARLVDVLATFDIDAAEVKPYSQLMQEANEELRRLNLSYEQLVMELKQAKAHAEQLARELREANASLRERVARDGLTGLYNHRTFQELLVRELSEALRYRRPMSLIMFDIDHFKHVNDSYGHPAGDTVLRAVARYAGDTVRGCDVAARYGGEEFAVILPETDAQGALILAERLRCGIEALRVEAGEGQLLQVTVSLGVCACRGEPGESPAQLLETADKALYAAKKAGRNRVVCAR